MEELKQTTKAELRQVIDSENGDGYSLNVNLNGYTFRKNDTFVLFELKSVEEVEICHIKYVYFKNMNDLITVMASCCNFWMGNSVRFIFYKEKSKKKTVSKLLEELGFRTEVINKPNWKYRFSCLNKECKIDCSCPVYSFYK